jgi:hypothetical protein
VASLTIQRRIPPTRLVEIRAYGSKPGARDEYDRLLCEAAAPLLRRFEIDVVAVRPRSAIRRVPDPGDR